MRVGGKRLTPTALPSGRRTNTQNTETWAGPKESLEKFVWKISPSPEFQRRIIHSVKTRYTDYIIWLVSNKILYYLDGRNNIFSKKQGVEYKALPKDRTPKTSQISTQEIVPTPAPRSNGHFQHLLRHSAQGHYFVSFLLGNRRGVIL